MEYPKALYLQGECRVVADFAEDEAAQAEGFTDWTTDHERVVDAADEVEGADEAPAAAAAKRAYNRKPKAD